MAASDAFGCLHHSLEGLGISQEQLPDQAVTQPERRLFIGAFPLAGTLQPSTLQPSSEGAV